MMPDGNFRAVLQGLDHFDNLNDLDTFAQGMRAASPSGARTLELRDGQGNDEKDRGNSDLFSRRFLHPELNGMDAVPVSSSSAPVAGDVSGWKNGDALQTGTQSEMLFSNDGEFDPNRLEPTSAGQSHERAKQFQTVFRTSNPNNPDFAPASVTYVDISQFPIEKGRYLVSEEMTDDINRTLTRANMGYPIGINFRFLSAVEGGSGHKANIPLNRSNARNNLDVLNRSGVTVGSGFDLGQLARGKAGEATLREYGFPESLIRKFSPYLGKKRMDAFNELDKKPLILNDEELDFVNRKVMARRGNECIVQWDRNVATFRRTGVNTPYFHELTSKQQTIIFSRYYHQGPSWVRKNKGIYGSMVRNDWKKVMEGFETMISKNWNIWPSWKRDRFVKERKFLKESN